MCSIVVLDIYNCLRVGSVYRLASDLRMLCPYFDPRGALFVWTVISTALYPIGIPLIMVFFLYAFDVPRMAR